MGSVVYTKLPNSRKKPVFKNKAEQEKAAAEHIAFLKAMGVKVPRNATKY